MKIKFEGYLDIPDGSCDSRCDVDHLLIRELQNTNFENADAFYDYFKLKWESTLEA